MTEKNMPSLKDFTERERLVLATVRMSEIPLSEKIKAMDSPFAVINGKVQTVAISREAARKLDAPHGSGYEIVFEEIRDKLGFKDERHIINVDGTEHHLLSEKAFRQFKPLVGPQADSEALPSKTRSRVDTLKPVEILVEAPKSFTRHLRDLLSGVRGKNADDGRER